MSKLATTILILVLAVSTSYAADYTIDADHSVIGFKVKHLAISSVAGKFGEFKGSFSYDPANIAASKTEATIAAKSVDTNQKKRDDHLRNSDFLAVDKFPEIKFVSTAVRDATPDGFKLDGNLTIMSTTKPVTLDVTFGGIVKDMYGKERAAFAATTKFNRKDFGVTWSKTLDSGALVVGDEITVSLEIEGVKS